MLFGDILKKLRINANETQEEAGNFFGVACNTVSYWESNKSLPPLNLVPKIAKHYGVTTDYILGVKEEDLSKIEKLKSALKENNLMAGDDLTIEELRKALSIVEMMKDTNK